MQSHFLKPEDCSSYGKWHGKNSSIESFLSPEIIWNKPIPRDETSKCMHRLHDLRDMRKCSTSIGIRTVFLDLEHCDAL